MSEKQSAGDDGRSVPKPVARILAIEDEGMRLEAVREALTAGAIEDLGSAAAEVIPSFSDFWMKLGAFESFAEVDPYAVWNSLGSLVREDRDAASFLAVLASKAPEEKDRGIFAKEAWSALTGVEDPEIADWILVRIAPQMPLELRPRLLPTAREIADGDVRARVLAAIVPALAGRARGEVLFEALQAARKAVDARRVGALMSLLPLLEDERRSEVLEEAFETANSVSDSGTRAWLLANLMKEVPHKVRQELSEEILELVGGVSDEHGRAELIVNLAQLEYWSAEGLPDLKRAAEQIGDGEARTRALLILEQLSHGPTLAPLGDASAPGPESSVAPSSDPGAAIESADEGESAQAAPEAPSGKPEEPVARPRKKTAEKARRPRPADPAPAEAADSVETVEPAAAPKPRRKPSPAAPTRAAVPIHADDPAVVDELNRADFAKVLARCIRQVRGRESGIERPGGAPHPDGVPGEAFMVHLHGPWGSGKSSVLNFLRAELQPRRPGRVARLLSKLKPKAERKPAEAGDELEKAGDQWIVVDFNAWRHQRVGPPWWALIQSLYRQARAQLVRQVRLRSAIRLFARQQLWNLRTGWAPNMLAVAVLLWVVGAAASQAVGAAEQLQEVEAPLKVLALFIGGWGLLRGEFRSLFHGSAEAAERYLQLSRDPVKPIFRHFEKLVRAIGGPVAIFIDDLDRCEGRYVVELLRGLQTLFHRARVTYVIAADREWLRASYEKWYKDFRRGLDEPGRPLGYLFLDKLFQVSVALPTMATGQRRGFLQGLVQAPSERQSAPARPHPADRRRARRRERQVTAEAREREQEVTLQARQELGAISDPAALERKIHDPSRDPFEQRIFRREGALRFVTPEVRAETEHVLQRYSSLLERNPRSMKRLVNAFGLHQSIASLVGIPVGLGPLVRWTILGMRWPLLATALERRPELLDERPEVARARLAELEATKRRLTPWEEAETAARRLLRDPEVQAVLNGAAAGGDGPAALDDDALDRAALQRILGIDPTPRPAGDRSPEAGAN